MSYQALRRMAAASLALAAALPGLCLAQNSGPEWFRITTYHVKPEMIPDWESLIKNEVIPAYKKAGIPFLAVWETANFGIGGEYVAALPVKFADLDGPNPLSKALAPDALAGLIARARKCLADSRSMAVVNHPELSIVGEMTGPPSLAIVTTVKVAAGRGAEFRNLLKNDILPAYKKAGVQQYWVYENGYGGDPNEWTTLLLYNKYADLDAGVPLVKAMGQEGFEKFLARTAGVITSVNRTLSHYRLDLSVGGGN